MESCTARRIVAVTPAAPRADAWACTDDAVRRRAATTAQRGARTRIASVRWRAVREACIGGAAAMSASGAGEREHRTARVYSGGRGSAPVRRHGIGAAHLHAARRGERIVEPESL